MGNKTCIWLAVGITLLVLTPAARAQDEQWLQYHSEREAHRIVRNMGRSFLLVLSNKPQGVEVSQLKTQKQFFAQWPTRMVESGQLWHDQKFFNLHGSVLFNKNITATRPVLA